MSSSADDTRPTLDGLTAAELARQLSLPRVALFDTVGSTLDVAHDLAAEGVPTGTLVIADEQQAGRGRHGRHWMSERGAGLWLTLVERPTDTAALEVLALRCGLYAAEALAPIAGGEIGVKWPNDLYIGGGKLAGILIETRWRGAVPDHVAIGFGLNVRAPELDTGAGLAPGTSRVQALARLVPALRAATAAEGSLTSAELSRWRARDIGAGRTATAPVAGRVLGISATGELLVAGALGAVVAQRSGSLTFAEPLA